jgi:hypothetical protein
MFERSPDFRASDESLNNFLDTLDLSYGEREFLKAQCADPAVANEVRVIWHNLECWGEDCQDSAIISLRDLISRIKAPRPR